MRKTVKSNPEELIRELLINKYKTLENACKMLNIGTSQSLHNNLNRWSKNEGTFKAFYNILSQLNYKLEYSAIPVFAKEFNYDKLSRLLDCEQIEAALNLINSEKSSLGEIEYVKLLDQIESRKSILENKYRTTVTFSAEYLKKLLDFHNSSDLSKNLEFIVDGYFKINSISDELTKLLESKEKTDLLKKINSVFFKTINKVEKHNVKKVMADDEEIWTKLENNKIYEITNFFEEESILKFRFKKNKEKLKIISLEMVNDTIYAVNGKYDEQEFEGRFDIIEEKINKIKLI